MSIDFRLLWFMASAPKHWQRVRFICCRLINYVASFGNPPTLSIDRQFIISSFQLILNNFRFDRLTLFCAFESPKKIEKKINKKKTKSVNNAMPQAVACACVRVCIHIITYNYKYLSIIEILCNDRHREREREREKFGNGVTTHKKINNTTINSSIGSANYWYIAI